MEQQIAEEALRLQALRRHRERYARNSLAVERQPHPRLPVALAAGRAQQQLHRVRVDLPGHRHDRLCVAALARANLGLGARHELVDKLGEGGQLVGLLLPRVGREDAPQRARAQQRVLGVLGVAEQLLNRLHGDGGRVRRHLPDDEHEHVAVAQQPRQIGVLAADLPPEEAIYDVSQPLLALSLALLGHLAHPTLHQQTFHLLLAAERDRIQGAMAVELRREPPL
eukprot:2827306-Pleurochrysis_carterae.AAC.2